MRLLLVDDEQLIREGMAFLLGSFDDIEVVAQASNGQEAIACCDNYPVEIVLMDIRMPIMDGVAATRQIKASHPNIKILILTTFKDDDYIKEAIEYGASGYLLKNSTPQLIYSSLKTAYTGGIVLDEDMGKQMLSAMKPKVDLSSFDISERELSMIEMMADGLSNKAIGEALFLTEGTVKNSITKLLSKLELKDRTQVVTYAFRNGLIR